MNESKPCSHQIYDALECRKERDGNTLLHNGCGCSCHENAVFEEMNFNSDDPAGVLPENVLAAHLRFLGKTTKDVTTGKLDLVEWKGGLIRVKLHCNEFTSLCPVTGQPDYAKVSIEYTPGSHIIETKSVKLFLQSYRSTEKFNEQLTDDICQEIFKQLQPYEMTLRMLFNPRGGIAVECVASAARGGADTAIYNEYNANTLRRQFDGGINLDD